MLHLNKKNIYFGSESSNHLFAELVDGKELEGPPGSETVLKNNKILAQVSG